MNTLRMKAGSESVAVGMDASSVVPGRMLGSFWSECSLGPVLKRVKAVVGGVLDDEKKLGHFMPR